MQWTALDLKNFSAAYEDMAEAVLDFRSDNRATLTQLQKNSLNAQFGSLLSYSEQFENEALNNALVDIDGAVSDLQSATLNATSALGKITDVQKVLAIAVAAVGVGFAILNPSPGTIAGSLNTLVQAIQQATAPPTSGTVNTSAA